MNKMRSFSSCLNDFFRFDGAKLSKKTIRRIKFSQKIAFLIKKID